MSLSITQNPTAVALAQSPMPFTVVESDANLRTSSSFQYVGELYYWQGGLFASSSTPNYTIVKYPNASGVGIFDVSKIINSTLTSSLINNGSNVEYYAAEFYWEWLNGTTYTTGSHIRTGTYRALDGYQLMGTNLIGQNLYDSTPHWPLMTDGPVTQSVIINDRGFAGVYVGTTGGTQPTKIRYVDNFGNAADYALSSNASSSTQITQYPFGPAETGFPLSITANTQWYTIQAYNSGTPIGTSIKFELVQQQKYDNIRVGYKNRFGQFDFIDFYMQNRKSFSVQKRSYQPQLGTFNASSLSYATSDSNTKNYIVDANQSIQVNTNWLYEEENDLIKQMMVSDEIYWFYDQPNSSYVRPLNISTSNIQFKTGVNDHLIQYTFDFTYGQSYKLIF
jgi:hypothetical protein